MSSNARRRADAQPVCAALQFTLAAAPPSVWLAVSQIINKEGVKEANRENDGWVIKDGIIVIIKDSVIPSGKTRDGGQVCARLRSGQRFAPRCMCTPQNVMC